tara:strand:- start:608 stop:754 length:147 start_codon:yes stop_codon:yes gene_type:complete
LINFTDYININIAAVVELVDTPDLGSGARKGVKVRVLSAAHFFEKQIK